MSTASQTPRVRLPLIPYPSTAQSTQGRSATVWRSEEHTSELQSRPQLVCRLLLEKKNDGMGEADRLGDCVKYPQLVPIHLHRACLPRAHPFLSNAPAPTEIYTLSLHDALPIPSATVW